MDRLINIQYVSGTVLPRVEQLEKLAVRVERMIDALAATKNIRLHAHIDQFYYMQKKAELTLWVSMLKQTCPAETLLLTRICDRYGKIVTAWKKDVRYLQRHLRTEAGNLTRPGAREDEQTG